MTTPSQFDPLAQAPRTLRARLASKFGRTIEPLAMNLVSWCRSLDHRVESVEARLEADEAQLRAAAQALRGIDAIGPRLDELEALAPKITAFGPKLAAAISRFAAFEAVAEAVTERLDALAAKVNDLDVRADQAFWAREAVVERLNRDDAREEQVIGRVVALEEKAEQLYWGREALVERMNRDDAVVEAIDLRLTGLQEKVDDQVPLPLAFGLDYLAMGRRLAAMEDQVEALLSQLGKGQDGQPATLVAFPAAQDKAAG